MRIGIQTLGSLGDIRPFLSLVDGLRRDGHYVTLVITCIDQSIDWLTASRHGVKIVSAASPVISDMATCRRLNNQ